MRVHFLTVFMSVLGITGSIESAIAQTWSPKTENNYENVVAIVKPRKSGNCSNHAIRRDGRVFDARKGTRGSYLIVDQVVSLTGTIGKNKRNEKIWEVMYEPSQTIMWLHNCDLSIPRLAN